MKKRILCVLIAALVLMSAFSLSAFAADAGTYAAQATSTGHANHALCTKEGCSINHSHTVIDDWKPISSKNDLPKAPGNYYLTTNIYLFETYYVPEGDVTICLNGHSFAQQSLSLRESFVIKNTSGTFNVCNCEETEQSGRIMNQSSATTAKGSALHISKGTFNLYSGGIINSKTQDCGGGIYINGATFNMYGGRIMYNSTTIRQGGGIYMESGTFRMYGGVIAYNRAETVYGGGIYIYGGNAYFLGGEITGNTAKSYVAGVTTITGKTYISGNVKIQDNYTTYPNDATREAVTTGEVNLLAHTSGLLNINGPLTGNDGDIGITIAYDETGAFAQASGGVTLTDADAKKFVSDTSDKGYDIFVSGNKLYMGEMCTVSFDSNGGTGTKESINTTKGSYTLPTSASGITPPVGMEFAGWAESADGDVIDGAAIELTGDKTLYAVWKYVPAFSEVTYGAPENGEMSVTVNNSAVNSGATVESGKAVTVTAQPASGYVVDTVKYNGNTVAADADGKYTFVMPGEAVEIVVTFKPIGYSVYIAGVEFTSVNTVIDNSDNPEILGSATYDPTTKTLTLNNFKFEGDGGEVGWDSGAIFAEDDLKIVLVGENSLINTNATAYSSYCIKGLADIEICGDGEASLYASAGVGIEAKNLTVSGVELEVYAFGDWNALRASSVTIEDSNVKVTTDNMFAGNIYGDAITIKNSELIGTSKYKGLEGNEISIIDSKVDLSAEQHAIDCEGDVEIKNSTFNAFIPDNYAYAKLSAIRTAGNVIAEGSKVTITAGENENDSCKTYGIEAKGVTFDKTDVTINSASGACLTTDGVTVVGADVFGDGGEITSPDASTFEAPGFSAVANRTVTYKYGLADDVVVTVKSGTVLEPFAPVLSGYIFSGFYADSDFTIAFDFTQPITEDTTVYVKFVATVVSIEKTGTSGLVDTYTITYSDGTTATFTVTNGEKGEQGEQGEQGIQGIQGIPGADGHTPVITIQNGYWYIDGVNTNQVAQGIQGAQGEQGEQGPQGEKGDAGKDGVTPMLRINAETNEWEVSYDNGATWTTTGVKATGDKGADGADGKDGADGADGKDGADGADGKDGADGVTPKLRINTETNEWEVSYDNGATWISMGVKATGEQGAQGPKGEKGDKGDTGADGAQGPQGESGAAVVSTVIASVSLLGNAGLFAWIFIKRKKYF